MTNIRADDTILKQTLQIFYSSFLVTDMSRSLCGGNEEIFLLSSNSEANATKLLEYLEEMYFMHNDVFRKLQPLLCVLPAVKENILIGKFRGGWFSCLRRETKLFRASAQ